MRKVPPTWVRLGKERLVNDVQLTKERDSPTMVKLGAEIVVRVVVKNPKLLVTFLRASKLMDWMLRNEALDAVRRAGRLTVSWGELAEMARAPLMILRLGCSIVRRNRLLSSIRKLRKEFFYQCQDRPQSKEKDRSRQTIECQKCAHCQLE